MELNSEGFNSQEMSCCRSLSPPSEPPHIGKWFSSYEYASSEASFGEMSCCRSLSPPSEPPHIEKWVSSYEYTSSEASFGEMFVDFFTEDAKFRKLGSISDQMNEKDSGMLGRYRKRKTVHACDRNRSSEPDNDKDIQHNQNMSLMNVDSLLLPSEPPDIRNWFSSYPELDSGASLKMSVPGDIQLDQQDDSNKLDSQEGVNDGKNRRTFGNENVTNEKDAIAGLNEGRNPLESNDANVVCYTDSVSLPSEPPDIRNWFSSYVYESPALLTDGDLGVPFVDEIQSVEYYETIIMKNGRKANCDISNRFGTRIKKSSHMEPDTSQGICRVEESDKNSDCFPILSEAQTQCINHPNTGMEKIVDKKDPTPPRNETVSDLTVSKCSRKLLHEKTSMVKCSNSEFCSGEKVPPVNPASFKDNVRNSNSFQGTRVLKQVEESAEGANKENLQPDVAKNRFVSTKSHRKKKPNNDNPYFSQKQHIPAVDRNHFIITKKVQGSTTKVGSKRDAMSDVTMQHSIEQEVSGKWKCPQRSKSNLQPPMKQLRLEQWVTRA